MNNKKKNTKQNENWKKRKHIASNTDNNLKDEIIQ